MFYNPLYFPCGKESHHDSLSPAEKWAERYHCTIVASMRQYVSGHQMGWDPYKHPQMYAENTESHLTKVI